MKNVKREGTYFNISEGSLPELPDDLALKSNGCSPLAPPPPPPPTAIRSGGSDLTTGLLDAFGSVSDGDCDVCVVGLVREV